MADETPDPKLSPSPIPGMNLADFNTQLEATKAEVKTWDDVRTSMILNILLENSVRFQWKNGSTPGVILFAMALTNHINATLKTIYKEEGINPVEVDDLQVTAMPYLDRSKMN